jgi:quinolinate synthase
MLKFAQTSEARQFIVATEAGILHELQRTCPEKEFIPVPPETSVEGDDGLKTSDFSCHCNECQYMKMNSLLKIYNALK